MRIDEDPAVLPERCCGQTTKLCDDLSLPLSTLHVSLSQNTGCGSTGNVPTSRPLISRDVLAACYALAALCLCRVWFCFLATGAAGLSFFQGAPSAKLFASVLADTIFLAGFFVALWLLSSGIRRTPAGERLANVVFLLFLVVPANAIWNAFQRVMTKLYTGYWRNLMIPALNPVLRILLYGVLVLLLASGLYFHRQSVRIACRM